jgi:hypothetical protein
MNRQRILILLIVVMVIIDLVALTDAAFNRKVNNLNDCLNKDVSETAFCLRDYAKTFYKYVVRNDTNQTLEELKKNGGDCYDWSRFYDTLSLQLGFNSKMITLYGNNTGHRFTVIWDNKTNYCELDNLLVSCYKQKN